MWNEYADTEKLLVVFAYVQELEGDTVEYLKKTAPDIPVYNLPSPPDSPCGRGIPDACSFDHTGALVEHDHPMALAKIEKSSKASKSLQKEASELRASLEGG